MYQTAAPRFFRAFFTSILMIFLLAMPCSLKAAVTAPDLTAPGEIAKVHRAWTWNLGPSGMRGWIYHAWPATMNHDDVTAFAPYQILVTAVAEDTPAAGVMAVDDVILGVSTGKGAVPLFTSDARKSLGWAIGEAEAGKGVLRFKRWRAGTVTDVSITLPVMGAFSDTAPYNCPKSATIMANAAKSLAQRLKTDGWRKDLDGREAISALALLATGVTATGRVLAVLADATVSRGHVTALLAVLVSLRRGNEGGGVSVMSLGMRRSARDASSGLAPSRRRVHRRARVNDPASRG